MPRNSSAQLRVIRPSVSALSSEHQTGESLNTIRPLGSAHNAWSTLTFSLRSHLCGGTAVQGFGVRLGQTLFRVWDAVLVGMDSIKFKYEEVVVNERNSSFKFSNSVVCWQSARVWYREHILFCLFFFVRRQWEFLKYHKWAVFQSFL